MCFLTVSLSVGRSVCGPRPSRTHEVTSVCGQGFTGSIVRSFVPVPPRGQTLSGVLRTQTANTVAARAPSCPVTDLRGAEEEHSGPPKPARTTVFECMCSFSPMTALGVPDPAKSEVPLCPHYRLATGPNTSG